MEEGKGKPSSLLPVPRRLGRFYVEMEDIPMFKYDPDPANSSLIREKKEEILGLRLSWGIRSRYSDSWVDDLKSSKIQEKWLNEAKERMDFGDLDPYSGVVGDAVENTASDGSLDSSSTSTDSEDPESNPPEQAQAGSKLSRKIWKKVIDELGHYASQVDGRIQPGPLAGVTWVADGLVGQELRDRLLRGSEALEKLARKEGNWHPGTEGRVLNLIDPSMHAFIPGQTRILKKPFVPNKRGLVGTLAHFHSSSSRYVYVYKDEEVQNEVTVDQNIQNENDQNQEDQNQEEVEDQNQEEVEDQNEEEENDENDGTKFQWLPADVEVDLDGNCHFTSYVNNLNPFEDGEMYGVLEEILSSTFVPLWSKLLTHMRHEHEQNLENQSIEQEDQENDGEDDDENEELEDESENGSEIDPVVNLKGRRIQVIVRMATTHLTPDNPKHSGGRWHVDGMPEEKIVAVGLHYYSNHNITTARLGLGNKFRVLNPRWRRSSRIRDSGELANIETKEGRSIVFSNRLNHRVPTFELVDPALPGHRRILAFFFVDPGTPILSTARVPCQQRSWYLVQLRKIFSPPLPAEMVEMIASYLNGPLDLKKAKKFRDVMREERNSIIVLVYDHGDGGTEKSFRVKPSANLGPVTGSFSGYPGSNQFSYDGARVNYSHSPAQLGMKSGDVIDLYYARRCD